MQSSIAGSRPCTAASWLMTSGTVRVDSCPASRRARRSISVPAPSLVGRDAVRPLRCVARSGKRSGHQAAISGTGGSHPPAAVGPPGGRSRRCRGRTESPDSGRSVRGKFAVYARTGRARGDRPWRPRAPHRTAEPDPAPAVCTPVAMPRPPARCDPPRRSALVIGPRGSSTPALISSSTSAWPNASSSLTRSVARPAVAPARRPGARVARAAGWQAQVESVAVDPGVPAGRARARLGRGSPASSRSRA